MSISKEGRQIAIIVNIHNDYTLSLYPAKNYYLAASFCWIYAETIIAYNNANYSHCI